MRNAVLAIVLALTMSAPALASRNVPWSGEQHVFLRYRGVPELVDDYRNVVIEMNRLTNHMPSAPQWVFVREAFMTCQAMSARVLSGINVCTERPEDDYLPHTFCAAGGPAPVKTRKNGMADGWYSPIYVHLPPVCTKGQQSLAFHETAHAWLAMPHIPGSGTAPPYPRPWGAADFARAEEWFGRSAVPFCAIYPDGYGCS